MLSRSFTQSEGQYPSFGGTNTSPTLANTVGTSGSSGGYNPGFQVGKTFKNIAPETLNYNSWMNPEYLKGWAASNPEMFAGMDLETALTPNMIEGESQQIQQGWSMSPQLKSLIDAYNFSVKGASGLEDGRTLAATSKDTGELGYAGKPYSYDPAGDTLKSLTKAAGLVATAFGGIGMLGHGPLAGLFGGAGGTGGMTNGAFLGESAWTPTAGGSLFEGAAAAGGGLGELGSAASIADGGGMLGSAFADAAASSGSLLPGVSAGSLIPTGAQLGAAGGGSLLAGGLGTAGSATSAASGFGGLVDKLLGSKTGTVAAGNLLGSIGQIYQGNRAQDAYSDLAKSMTNNFAPGSAYEKTLRQQLERRDAASGRRSQYGPREVELQAQLAKMQSGQGQTLMDLIGRSQGGLGTQLQGGMMGLNNLMDLYKLFGGGG
jgi:hypothetical protein